MKIVEYLNHSFISDFLDESSIVIDLGGNVGEFGKFVFEKFNSYIYIVEPIPELFKQIVENPKIKKFQYCISNEKEVEISIPENQCATIYDKNFKNKIICQGITLEEFLKQNNISKIDLLKVDIEGAEIEMLETTPVEIFKNINQITIEFNDFLWPELKLRVERIKRRLENLRFYCIPFYDFSLDTFSIRNNINVLFIKKNLITKFQYVYLYLFYRHLFFCLIIFKKIFKKLEKTILFKFEK